MSAKDEFDNTEDMLFDKEFEYLNNLHDDMKFEVLQDLLQYDLQQNIVLTSNSVQLEDHAELMEMYEKFKNDFLQSCKGDEVLLEGALEGFLEGALIRAVLKFMSICLCFNRDYHKNIENFDAVYQFTNKKGDFYAVATFKKGKMKVTSKKAKNPTFSLIFKDDESLRKLLFSGSLDILDAMLNQDVSFKGNINYLNKFAYMAMHLMLCVTHKIHFADGN